MWGKIKKIGEILIKMKNNLGFHETFQVAQGSKIKVIVIGCHIYLPQKKFDPMFQERLGQIYVYCQKTMKRTNLRRWSKSDETVSEKDGPLIG